MDLKINWLGTLPNVETAMAAPALTRDNLGVDGVFPMTNWQYPGFPVTIAAQKDLGYTQATKTTPMATSRVFGDDSH